MLAKLFGYSGSYSLPYLIHLYNKKHDIDMYFVNDTEDHVFEGVTYSAESFHYQPSPSEYGLTGGGTLEISVVGNQVIDLAHTDINLDVIGVIQEDGEITKLKQFSHRNGRVTMNRNKAKFVFSRDERLDMSFPALVWNAQNNRGNT